MEILNLEGLNCPLPVLKTKKFLAQLAQGATVCITTTDPASIQDFKDFCSKTDHTLVSQEMNNETKIITTIIRCK